MAVAVQSGSPCRIDDYHFEYDPRNLSRYYSDVKICATAENQAKKEPFFSTGVSRKYEKYVINVPMEVKSSLEFCHEDPAAWFRGVILKHMLHISTFSEQSIKKLLKESKFPNSKLDTSHITSVHIRSPDVGRAVKFLQPREATVSLCF